MSDGAAPSRWSAAGAVRRGAEYDERWTRMEAAGHSIHGEADFIERFSPTSVLDAGCGTGRVAIELGRRGIDVVGVDLDPPMLDEARRKAPRLTWVESDLCGVDLQCTFDVIALAGNVMIFLRPGTEAEVISNLADHLAPEGVLIAGFQLGRRYGLGQYDADCEAAGLILLERYATWECAPCCEGDDYAVSVHARPGVQVVSGDRATPSNTDSLPPGSHSRSTATRSPITSDATTPPSNQSAGSPDTT